MDKHVLFWETAKNKIYPDFKNAIKTTKFASFRKDIYFCQWLLYRLLPEMSPHLLHVPGGSVWMRDSSGLTLSSSNLEANTDSLWEFCENFTSVLWAHVNEQIHNKCMGRGLYSLSSSFLGKNSWWCAIGADKAVFDPVYLYKTDRVCWGSCFCHF